jgi:uncharacterized protein (TIGR01319 family)
MDFRLACACVETASIRHAGTIEETYTPAGRVFLQTGKDLRAVNKIVLTGGALIHSGKPVEIARRALYSKKNAASLRPLEAEVYVDSKYILASMGLLGEKWPDAAFKIMTEEIKINGIAK